MDQTIVDVRFAEHKALLKLLHEHGELSMANSVEGDFRKVLIVSAASYFEKLIVQTLHRAAGGVTDVPMREALINTTFRREKFSSLFSWGEKNINGFLRIFGVQFKDEFSKTVSTTQLKDGVSAFLKLGEQRNHLVHNDFADSTTDQTVDEVFGQYKAAQLFVEHLCERLGSASRRQSEEDAPVSPAPAA